MIKKFIQRETSIKRLQTEIKVMDEMCRFFARAIRDIDPIIEGGDYCVFCIEDIRTKDYAPSSKNHSVDCPWVLAGEYLDD